MDPKPESPASHGTAHPWSLPELHRQLALTCRERLTPRTPEDDRGVAPGLLVLEGQFLAQECAYVEARAALAPTDRAGFRGWFEELVKTGPGQDDPLFDFLAKKATLSQMRWFLAQEAGGEIAFDELVALTQVRLPREAKVEMTRDAFEEVGRAAIEGLPTPTMQVEPGWETLALSNLMAGFALDRRYAYHSVGALGVVELTTPGRRSMVIAGLTRLGVDASARRYQGMHPAIDLAHSRRWNDHVIDPLVAADPKVAHWIAQGALARLNSGKRCFNRYRIELGLSTVADTTLIRSAGA